MKAHWILLIACLFITNVAIACGDTCAGSSRDSACGFASVDRCKCTDPGYDDPNHCMSAEEYCKAFGNIGGL